MNAFAQTAIEAVEDLDQQIDQLEDELEKTEKALKTAMGTIEEQSRHIALLEIAVNRLSDTAEEMEKALT